MIPEPTIEPITTTIAKRFSCREYLDQPIAADAQRLLQEFAAQLKAGPLGTSMRFQLLAANEQDSQALRGLGTYGSIKHPAGFLVGTVCPAVRDLEEYGFILEKLILYATALGLGTCWLGGAFTYSTFARKIAAADNEHIPAIAAAGYIPDLERARLSPQRRKVRSDQRLPWDTLFFHQRFGSPLPRDLAGPYALPLDMLRLCPSAHNKQPWRVVADGAAWHFYLQRTPDTIISLASTFLKVDDLQRIEMGIAMCHFELTARELGLDGRWAIHEPDIEKPSPQTEYTITWLPSAPSA